MKEITEEFLIEHNIKSIQIITEKEFDPVYMIKFNDGNEKSFTNVDDYENYIKSI
jgi:hypothetical protein